MGSTTYPMIIILEGLCGIGKTTMLKELQKEYKGRSELQFVEEALPLPTLLVGNKYSLLQKMYSPSVTGGDLVCGQLLYFEKEMEKLVKALFLHSNKKIIILDRWHLSCLLFTETYHKLGWLGEYSTQFLHNFMKTHHLELIRQLDTHLRVHILVITNHQSVKTSVDRLYYRRANPDELQRSYSDWIRFSTVMNEVLTSWISEPSQSPLEFSKNLWFTYDTIDKVKDHINCLIKSGSTPSPTTADVDSTTPTEKTT